MTPLDAIEAAIQRIENMKRRELFGYNYACGWVDAKCEALKILKALHAEIVKEAEPQKKIPSLKSFKLESHEQFLHKS